MGFTTDDYDVYEICFLSRVPPSVRGQRHEIYLNVKHGVEAKNYEGLGDANKLKPLEVELKRLEDLSLSIVQDFAHEAKGRRDERYKRIHKFKSFVFFYLLHVLSSWFSNMAGTVPSKIFQIKEAY